MLEYSDFLIIFGQVRLRPIQIASHYLYPGYNEETLLAIKTFKFWDSLRK